MKKSILFLLCLLSATGLAAQDYQALNDILSKIEKNITQNQDTSSYSLHNKKFVLMQYFEDHDERHILEFNSDNTITLIEVFDDKETGESISNIFTGDYIRKKSIVSVRADKLEGKKIGMPPSFTFYLLQANNMWYLKDLGNGNRWIENRKLGQKK